VDGKILSYKALPDASQAALGIASAVGQGCLEPGGRALGCHAWEWWLRVIPVPPIPPSPRLHPAHTAYQRGDCN
jgi:hypothetical protein